MLNSIINKNIRDKIHHDGEVPKDFKLVTWPDSQEVMDLDDAILVKAGPLFKTHGSQTYVVPRSTYNEIFGQ